MRHEAPTPRESIFAGSSFQLPLPSPSPSLRRTSNLQTPICQTFAIICGLGGRTCWHRIRSGRTNRSGAKMIAWLVFASYQSGHLLRLLINQSVPRVLFCSQYSGRTQMACFPHHRFMSQRGCSHGSSIFLFLLKPFLCLSSLLILDHSFPSFPGRLISLHLILSSDVEFIGAQPSISF